MDITSFIFYWQEAAYIYTMLAAKGTTVIRQCLIHKETNLRDASKNAKENIAHIFQLKMW